MSRDEYEAAAAEAVALSDRLRGLIRSLDAYEAAHPDEPRHDAREAVSS